MTVPSFRSPRTAGRMVVVAIALAVGQGPVEACDELAGRLITSAVRPAIEGLGCQDLGRAGLDKAQHRLGSVCYESSGPVSTVAMAAELSCRTGDGALIKASVSERISATAKVRASDCLVLGVELSASGDIGRILLRAFDVEGRARKALQDALAKVCRNG